MGSFLPERGIAHLMRILWDNSLGIGFLLTLIGIAFLWKERRPFLWAWSSITLPFTYFYTTYGAIDKVTMMAPCYALMTVVATFGLKWLITDFASKLAHNPLYSIGHHNACNQPAGGTCYTLN